MDKRLHPSPPPPKKKKLTSKSLRTTKAYLAAYATLLLNRIRPEMEKVFRKNWNGFRRNHSSTSRFLTIRWIIQGVGAKNLGATKLSVDFSGAFDFIHRKDRANCTYIWSSQRNYYSNNDPLQKQWLAHLMATPTSATMSKESCKKMY